MNTLPFIMHHASFIIHHLSFIIHHLIHAHRKKTNRSSPAHQGNLRRKRARQIHPARAHQYPAPVVGAATTARMPWGGVCQLGARPARSALPICIPRVAFLSRQVFLCSPKNALLSAALVSFDQALKAGHAKTSKFNALWIFSSLPQGRLVKRHKRRVEHGILG